MPIPIIKANEETDYEIDSCFSNRPFKSRRMIKQPLWTKSRPEKAGYYWCFSNNHLRMISVWCYSSNDKVLFTNEDGGASIDDPMYKDVYWMEIVAPELPSQEVHND